MADTQWTETDDGQNPNTVAVGIIRQVDQAFIEAGVKLVVAVGDLSDGGCTTTPCPAMQTRAAFAQDLYDHGIAFYPLRGNHDFTQMSATEFQRLFPQTRDGVNNTTPADAFAVDLGGDRATIPPRAGATFTAGANFDSPAANLLGLSYAFDFQGVRFVLLDQFTPLDGAANSIAAQQGWLTAKLAGRPAGSHAFVFGHKGILTDGHPDVLFGDDPTSDPAAADAFITSLATNGVRFYLGGHDHMHLHEIVSTTDGTTAHIHELVCASDSSKFYTPFDPSIDDIFNVPAYGHGIQTRIAEDLYEVGYYLVTIDGATVTIDYYAAPTGYSGPIQPALEWNLTATPALTGNWMRRDTFGYALNGREFVIPQGSPYTVVRDASADTTAAILEGTNASTATDPLGNPLTKAVDTGWSPATPDTSSDLLTLWGLADAGSDVSDPYVLSMTFGATAPEPADGGTFGIASQDGNGNWLNAVLSNAGGSPAFVAGPWTPGAVTGTWGVDAASHTAWAALDRGGTFAVARFR
jgi:hypothetical protein